MILVPILFNLNFVLERKHVTHPVYRSTAEITEIHVEKSLVTISRRLMVRQELLMKKSLSRD